MALHPFLLGLKNILGFVKFFIYDGQISANFERVCLAVDYIHKSGPAYGFIIKPSKGVYFLGKCGSQQLARHRKQHLLDQFGLSPNVIRIHPDDCSQDSRTEYGAAVLGSFIGTPENIAVQLNSSFHPCRQKQMPSNLSIRIKSNFFFFVGAFHKKSSTGNELFPQTSSTRICSSIFQPEICWLERNTLLYSQ